MKNLKGMQLVELDCAGFGPKCWKEPKFTSFRRVKLIAVDLIYEGKLIQI
jgi:hypothetical protein